MLGRDWPTTRNCEMDPHQQWRFRRPKLPFKIGRPRGQPSQHKENFFAATPPLGTLNVISSMTATAHKGELAMVNDISGAFSHARTTRDLYVQFADEGTLPHEQRCAAKFNIPRMERAAQNWFEEYSSQLEHIGFTKGPAIACVFFHPGRGIGTMVHGDDYVSAGMAQDLRWMKQQLGNKCKVKTQMLGPSG